MIVRPAYGIFLDSKAQVMDHWNNNYDFLILTIHEIGRYMNRADAEKYAKGEWIEVRYGNNGEKGLFVKA